MNPVNVQKVSGTNAITGNLVIGDGRTLSVTGTGAINLGATTATSITGAGAQSIVIGALGAIALNPAAGTGVKVNGGSSGGTTGSENLYQVQIAMGTAPGYGLTISNGVIDPWFHINSNGVGFVGDGTTLPFWSIEDQPTFVREMRCEVVPAGSYSSLWAKSSSFALSPNSLQLWANDEVILQAGRSNTATNNNSRVILQGGAGIHYTQWGNSGTNNEKTVLDQAAGARFYQYDGAGVLKNLIQAGGNSFINGGNMLFGGTVTALGAAVSVTGSRVANPALLSLLTALASIGLIVDNTS